MLLAVVARTLCIVATSGAAVVVLLGYVPALAAPFSLPKEVAFELAGALAFAGFALALMVTRLRNVRPGSEAVRRKTT